MRGKWQCNCYFVGYCLQNLFKTACSMLGSYHLAFSPNILLKSKWCSHTVVLTTTDWKNSHLIQSERSDFNMVDNLSMTVHALPICMLTLLSVDEILLLRYMNRSDNFRGLLFNEIVPSCLKPMNCFIWVHIKVNACSMIWLE